MNTGDIYFNARNRPIIFVPRIAKNRKEARRWIVTQLLITDIRAENIQCSEAYRYLGHRNLMIKSYRRSYIYKGKCYTEVLRYPETVSGRYDQLFIERL